MRKMLRSKIHRALVTDANVDYEGSISVDEALLKAADIIPFEQVSCWNVTTGTRFTTYAITAQKGSGTICINGAAAHLAKRGDLLIIATFTDIDEARAAEHRPTIVLLGVNNSLRAP